MKFRRGIREYTLHDQIRKEDKSSEIIMVFNFKCSWSNKDSLREHTKRIGEETYVRSPSITILQEETKVDQKRLK